MSPEQKSANVNGLNLCWFEWGAQHRPAGTTLMVHGTGFHARCWDQIIKQLPDRHIIAVDLRGHGRSDKAGDYTWRLFAEDLIAFIDALDLVDITAVGHSMGGHSVTLTASQRVARFRRLVLIDPLIVPPAAYSNDELVTNMWTRETGEHPVLRRRNLFTSAAAMVENLKGRGSFQTWREDVLKDYCEHGLLPNPDGEGLVLACPPQVEVAIYAGSTGTDVYQAIPQITAPVRILRAQPMDFANPEADFSKSLTWPDLASRFSNATDEFYPQLTHFIPMQAPELVAKYILDPQYRLSE